MNDDYHYDEEALEARNAEHPVHPIFVSRWTPRELSGEEVTTGELNSLFEAARWAPSCYNWQPWRFVYARRGTPEWEKYLELLVPPNREWAQNAGALIVIMSYKYAMFRGNRTLIPTNSYDAGAAWAQLALEGSALGLVVHGMAGFDYDKAYEVVGADKDNYKVEAMAAVGRRPPKEERKSPDQISQRNPINTFAFEGKIEEKDPA